MNETRFKDTEIGKIPREWEMHNLRGICTVHSGKGLRVRSYKNKYPVIGGNGNIGYKTNCYNTEDSIVVGRVGALCGNVHRVKTKSWVTDNALILEEIAQSRMDLDFIYYLLKAKKLNRLCVGNAQPLITGSSLLSLELALPPLSEQRRIADALSKVDSLIESLDKLIAKKEAIKRGAMLELLSGKKRLPGFEGKWHKIFLKDLGLFKAGSTFPLSYQGKKKGIYPFFKVSDFNNPGNELSMSFANNYIDNITASNLGCNIIPKNSIIFAKIGEAIFVERKKPVMQNSCIDNNMMAFIPTKVFHSFILYYLKIISFGKLVEATALPSLGVTELGNLLIDCPPTLSEQRVIAHVLSTMDAEIDALKQKREKYQQVKQGMMQDLLTGRIRLVDNEAD